MTAVNVIVVSVIAGLTRNLCKQNELFGQPRQNKSAKLSFSPVILLLEARFAQQENCLQLSNFSVKSCLNSPINFSMLIPI
jgi:hypothetical protein